MRATPAPQGPHSAGELTVLIMPARRAGWRPAADLFPRPPWKTAWHGVWACGRADFSQFNYVDLRGDKSGWPAPPPQPLSAMASRQTMSGAGTPLESGCLGLLLPGHRAPANAGASRTGRCPSPGVLKSLPTPTRPRSTRVELRAASYGGPPGFPSGPNQPSTPPYPSPPPSGLLNACPKHRAPTTQPPPATSTPPSASVQLFPQPTPDGCLCPSG